MGTFTAQILVGTPHQNHGGITPTHCLFLSENSRPAWVLLPQNIFEPSPNLKNDKITWIPTVENMLEDALLMIAMHVIQDKEITGLAEKVFRNKAPHWVALYDDIDELDRIKLYEKCREIGNRFKIVITVMEESSITGQLKVIEDYKMDVEVCKPSFSRMYSAWQNEVQVKGQL